MLGLGAFGAAMGGGGMGGKAISLGGRPGGASGGFAGGGLHDLLLQRVLQSQQPPAPMPAMDGGLVPKFGALPQPPMGGDAGFAPGVMPGAQPGAMPTPDQNGGLVGLIAKLHAMRQTGSFGQPVQHLM